MKYRILLVTALLCSLSFTSRAAMVFKSQDVLPGGLSTLQDERAAWSSGLSSLVTEGFEDSFTLSNHIDFGSFNVSITDSDFTLFGSNQLTRTQGNNGIGFLGSAVLRFDFLDNISSFAIDWSSIDLTQTEISYSDEQGNIFSDIAPSAGRSGAGFFGITGINTSSISFDITSSEILEFDFIQFESVQAKAVSTPSIFIMMTVGLMSLFSLKRIRVKAPEAQN